MRRLMWCVLCVWTVALCASPVSPAGHDDPGSVSCAEEATQADQVLARLSQAQLHEPADQMRHTLAALEPSLRESAASAPSDARAQYRLAALLGVRADRESGRRRIAAANELHAQVRRVLALEADHPGAHYLLGRLHAGAMRLDGVTRFIAVRLLGAEALKSASWDSSQTHLETAERLAPCDPAHHFELARVYADRGVMDAAERERQHALTLTAERPYWASLRARAVQMPAQWRARR